MADFPVVYYQHGGAKCYRYRRRSVALQKNPYFDRINMVQRYTDVISSKITDELKTSGR